MGKILQTQLILAYVVMRSSVGVCCKIISNCTDWIQSQFGLLVNQNHALPYKGCLSIIYMYLSVSLPELIQVYLILSYLILFIFIWINTSLSYLILFICFIGSVLLKSVVKVTIWHLVLLWKGWCLYWHFIFKFK